MKENHCKFTTGKGLESFRQDKKRKRKENTENGTAEIKVEKKKQRRHGKRGG